MGVDQLVTGGSVTDPDVDSLTTEQINIDEFRVDPSDGTSRIDTLIENNWPGVRILLQPGGVYEGPKVDLYDHVSIIADGQDGLTDDNATIKLADGEDTDVIEQNSDPDTTALDAVYMRGITIDGNKANNTQGGGNEGNGISGAFYNSGFEFVYARECAGDGFWFQGSSNDSPDNSWTFGCFGHNCGRHALRTGFNKDNFPSGGNQRHWHFTAGNSGEAGVKVASFNTQLFSPQIYNSGGSFGQLRIQNGPVCKVIGGHIEGTSSLPGIRLENDGTDPVGARIRDVTLDGQFDDAFLFDTSDGDISDVLVDGLTIRSGALMESNSADGFDHTGSNFIVDSKISNYTFDGTFSGTEMNISRSNHTRLLINEWGENAGDPSSAGDWNGNGKEGVFVRDSTNDKNYAYILGAWEQL